MKNRVYEITRYLMTGGASTLSYLLVSNVADILGAPFVLSTFAGWLAAVAVAYTGHMRFTYRVAAQHQIMGPRYVINALFNLAFSEIITYIVIVVLERAYWEASAVIILTLPLFSYPMGKYWVFKNSPNTAEQTNLLIIKGRSIR